MSRPICEIILGVIAGAGVLGNFVSFLVFCMQRNKISITYWFMALAIVDFASLATSPMTVVYLNCMLTDAKCDGDLQNPLETVRDMLFTTHLLFLIGMSADRYITIAFPKISRRWTSKNKALVAVITLSIASILIHLPGYIYGISRPVISNCEFDMNSGSDDVNSFHDTNGVELLTSSAKSVSAQGEQSHDVGTSKIETIDIGKADREYGYSDFDLSEDWSGDYLYSSSGDSAGHLGDNDGRISVDTTETGSGDVTYDAPTTLLRFARSIQPTSDVMTTPADDATFIWGYVFAVRLVLMELVPIAILSILLCLLVSAMARSSRSLARNRSTKGRYIANLSGSAMVAGIGTVCIMCALPIVAYELLFLWLSESTIVKNMSFVYEIICFLYVSMNLPIYLTTDKKFRKDFRNFFSCKCC